jgi:hypothetical protein
VELVRTVEAAREWPALRGWVKAVRWVLAAIFIWPGATKLSGDLFMRAANDPALFPFFNALHETGLYWRFIGLSQVVAGALLLFRRTALLGALLCVPIYANIMVLLLSLPFDVPSIIAGAILCCVNLGLLLWYAPELAPVVRNSPASDGSLRIALRRAWGSARFRAIAGALFSVIVLLHILSLADCL